MPVPYMGWESPGGTTHYTPPNFQVMGGQNSLVDPCISVCGERIRLVNKLINEESYEVMEEEKKKGMKAWTG